MKNFLAGVLVTAAIVIGLVYLAALVIPPLLHMQ